jgi:hypothetical protein
MHKKWRLLGMSLVNASRFLSVLNGWFVDILVRETVEWSPSNRQVEEAGRN